MKRPIAISLSPNAQSDDIRLAQNMVFGGGEWKESDSIKEITHWFEKKYKARAFSFNSARASAVELLKAAGIGKGDEVIIQAFTCVAVSNSVIWAGAKPIFADIDKKYNLNPKDFENKITKNTRAVIIQHTFGIPADVKRIVAVAKKYKLLVIEDCAHSLGATVDGQSVGMFSDAAFFSFGRDKIISSVFGGMLVIKDGKIADNIVKRYESIPYPSNFWVRQQLLHPILFSSIILPNYTSGIGKLILVQLQNLGVLSKAVYSQEKKCERPRVFPSRLSNPLAKLALNQLGKLEQFNAHRKKIASMYFDQLKGIEGIILPSEDREAVWLRFPIQIFDKEKLLSFMKKNEIVLGDWYDVVTPKESLDYVAYAPGSCPKAEEYAESCVNLPTYPTLSVQDAQKVIQLIKTFYSHE